MMKSFVAAICVLMCASAVVAKPAEDKPKKERMSEKQAELLRQQVEEFHKNREKNKGKAMRRNGKPGFNEPIVASETRYITVYGKAIEGPVKNPRLGPSKPGDGATTPEPPSRDWQKVTAEQEKEADALVEQILAKWSRIESFTAHFERKRSSGQISGGTDGKSWKHKMQNELEGTYDLTKEGGKTLVRMEIQVGDAYNRVNDSGPRLFHATNWYDGDHMYVLRRWQEKYAAEKTDLRPGSMMLMGGEQFMVDLKRLYKLRVMESEKLGDREAYVIEGVTRQGEEKAGLAIHWFDKESGVLLQITVHDHWRRPQQSILLEDLKLNPDFPKDHFKFKAPRGVILQDKTTVASEVSGN